MNADTIIVNDITAGQIKDLRDAALADGDEALAHSCDNALSSREDGYENGEDMTTWSGAPTTRTAARAYVARIIAERA